jgi:hypothetical protein
MALLNVFLVEYSLASFYLLSSQAEIKVTWISQLPDMKRLIIISKVSM